MVLQLASSPLYWLHIISPPLYFQQARARPTESLNGRLVRGPAKRRTAGADANSRVGENKTHISFGTELHNPPPPPPSQVIGQQSGWERVASGVFVIFSLSSYKTLFHPINATRQHLIHGNTSI